MTTPLLLLERRLSFAVCESREVKVNAKLFNLLVRCARVTVGPTYAEIKIYVAERVGGLTDHPIR